MKAWRKGLWRRVGLLVLWLPRPPAPGHERSGLGRGGEAEGFREEEPRFGRGWETRSSRIPEELAFTFLSPFSLLLFMCEGGQEGSCFCCCFNSRDTNCPVPSRSSESVEIESPRLRSLAETSHCNCTAPEQAPAAACTLAGETGEARPCGLCVSSGRRVTLAPSSEITLDHGGILPCPQPPLRHPFPPAAHRPWWHFYSRS